MTVTRQSLRFKCSVKDCPWPKDKEIHVPWCLEIPDVEHWADKPTHQHFPKKGMGGRPSGSPLSVLKDARSMRLYVTRGAERHEVLERMCAVCKEPLFDGDDVVNNNPPAASLTETATRAVTGKSPTSSTSPKPSSIDTSSLPVTSRRGVQSSPSKETDRRAIEESRGGTPVRLDLDGAAAESARMPLPPPSKFSRARKRAEANSAGVGDGPANREKVAPATLADERTYLGALAIPETSAGAESLLSSLPTLASVCCGECIAAGFALDINHDPSIIPESPRIVAILCVTCHDRIDNGDWGNAVVTTIEDGQRIGIYRAWDVHNETLIERIIGVGRFSDGAEEGIPSTQAGIEVPPSASASAPSLSKEESDDQPDIPEAKDEAAPMSGGKAPQVEPHPSSDKRDLRRGDDGGGSLVRKVSANPDSLRGSGLTHEQRVAKAQEIKDMEWNRQWIAGDTGNAWIAELGEEAEQYLSDFGYVQESLANILRVCTAIPKALRSSSLRFSHHVVVADLNLEDIDEWLGTCETEQWSVAEFRRQVKGTKPRVKRWSLEELRERVAEYDAAGDGAGDFRPDEFLDWLGEQG